MIMLYYQNLKLTWTIVEMIWSPWSVDKSLISFFWIFRLFRLIDGNLGVGLFSFWPVKPWTESLASFLPGWSHLVCWVLHYYPKTCPYGRYNYYMKQNMANVPSQPTEYYSKLKNKVTAAHATRATVINRLAMLRLSFNCPTRPCLIF